MRSLQPIYRKDDTAYQLDRCRPQRQAIEQNKIRFHALARGGYLGQRLSQSSLPGVRSLGFWDAVGEQDWGLDWHRNDGLEICLLETGTMPFAVNDQKHLLSPGQLTLTLPWQAHVLGDPNIGWGRLHWIILDVSALRPHDQWRWPAWIVLTPADRSELASRLRGNTRPVWCASPVLLDHFRQIASRLQSPITPTSYSSLAIEINHLLLDLLELLRTRQNRVDPSQTSADHTVSLFLKDLQQNHQSLIYAWTVAEMAHHCGMGVTAFTDCCRRITNTTPINYLLRCRLQTAARLIVEQPDRKIIQIAIDCGFSSSQHFATRFHRFFGRSPSTYRDSRKLA